MKLVSLTIPDDPTVLAAWLERHLIGLDLAALVAELRAVHDDAGSPQALEELLGNQRDAVLARGLGALPHPQLRQLLRAPGALLDLQELVLGEGGPYWEQLPRSAELLRAVERARDACLGATPAAALRPRLAWYRRPWVVSLATAAAVLLAVYVPRWLNSPPSSTSGPLVVLPKTAPGWGWDRPGALPGDGTAGAYLSTLANAAEEWFKKRPDDAAALARRLNEFRQGCSTLIFAEHKPLPPAERAELVQHCRAWAVRLDRHLTDLENGEQPVAVREAVDQTVREIAQALRRRAEAL